MVKVVLLHNDKDVCAKKMEKTNIFHSIKYKP